MTHQVIWSYPPGIIHKSQNSTCLVSVILDGTQVSTIFSQCQRAEISTYEINCVSQLVTYGNSLVAIRNKTNGSYWFPYSPDTWSIISDAWSHGAYYYASFSMSAYCIVITDLQRMELHFKFRNLET